MSGSGPFHMDLEVKDKVVLVTGGAKGIRAAITQTCAREGGTAVAVDRDVQACQALHDEFRAQGLQARFIAIDLASAENCKAIVQQAIATFDHVDALVNNAGINDRVGPEHSSPQEFVCSLERILLHYDNRAHYSLAHLVHCSQAQGSHRPKVWAPLPCRPIPYGFRRNRNHEASAHHSSSPGSVKTRRVRWRRDRL